MWKGEGDFLFRLQFGCILMVICCCSFYCYCACCCCCYSYYYCHSPGTALCTEGGCSFPSFATPHEVKANSAYDLCLAASSPCLSQTKYASYVCSGVCRCVRHTLQLLQRNAKFYTHNWRQVELCLCRIHLGLRNYARLYRAASYTLSTRSLYEYCLQCANESKVHSKWV